MRGTIGVKPGYEIDFQALWMVIQEIVLLALVSSPSPIALAQPVVTHGHTNSVSGADDAQQNGHRVHRF